MTRRLKKIFQLIITIAIIVYLYFKFNLSFSEIGSELNYPIWLFVAIIIRAVVMPFLGAFRWKIFLKYVGVQESVFSLIVITFKSVFYGLLLPSSTGFDGIRILNIEKKHPDSRGKTGATVIAERLWGFLLLSIIGLIGSILISNYEEINRIRLIIVCILLGLVFLIFISSNNFIFNICNNLFGKIRIFKNFFQFLISLHETLTTLRIKKILIRAVPIMLLFQFCSILLAYFIFLAFGINIPLYYHLALLPIIQIISIIPISISGFGLRESAFVYFYSFLEVPSVIAFSVSIMYYLISIGVIALIGAILSVNGQLIKKDASK